MTHADNVFSPSFGNRPSLLVGRDKVIDSVMRGISDKPGRKGRATMLLGQRGMGKTVLLWEIADRAREIGFAVANPTAVRKNMITRIAEKLDLEAGKHLQRNRKRVSGGGVGALGFSASVTFEPAQRTSLSPEGRVYETARALSEHGVPTLFLVDELQSNSEEVRSLIGAYQEMVGEGFDVAIVLAGLPASVSATLNDRVLTFANRAQKVELDPLSIEDVDAYYSQAFKSADTAVPRNLQRRAAESTMGSPYLMQLIGHYVVMLADDDRAITPEALEEALACAACEFQNDVCETTIAALSDGDVRYLKAMADICENGRCRSSDVATTLGVSSDYGQQYRRRLIDAGVIASTRRGWIEFAVPYLREHLAAQK